MLSCRRDGSYSVAHEVRRRGTATRVARHVITRYVYLQLVNSTGRVALGSMFFFCSPAVVAACDVYTEVPLGESSLSKYWSLSASTNVAG